MISIFKIVVMMIGEMDYGTVFDDREGDTDRSAQIWYVVVTYIQFAVFVVFMTILVMNLLVSILSLIITIITLVYSPLSLIIRAVLQNQRMLSS
jgi:hypothetical protein